MAKLTLDIVIVRLLGPQSEGSWVQLTVGLKTATSHGFSILSKSYFSQLIRFLISSCGFHICKTPLVPELTPRGGVLAPEGLTSVHMQPHILAKKTHFNLQMAVSGFLYHTQIHAVSFLHIFSIVFRNLLIIPHFLFDGNQIAT